MKIWLLFQMDSNVKSLSLVKIQRPETMNFGTVVLAGIVVLFTNLPFCEIWDFQELHSTFVMFFLHWSLFLILFCTVSTVLDSEEKVHGFALKIKIKL
jgi:hypothetical protein